MNVNLVSSILRSKWAIDPDAAQSYLPAVMNLITQGAIKVEFDFSGYNFTPRAVGGGRTIKAVDDDGDFTGFDGVPDGSVAVIPLQGPLMKNDQWCGPVGTATIGEWIKNADNSREIDAIVLQVDSPGGTVDGTVALSEIVASTGKPIVAFADGMMASAALWIGASADEIVASDNKAEIGSIGVVTSFADVQPYYEKMGIKFHDIVASQSSDKLKWLQELRAGKYEDYRKQVLDPLAQDFIDHISSRRPGVKKERLSGNMYFAQDLTGELVDSIGPLDHAAERALALAEERKGTKNSKNTTMQQFSNINKVLGVDSLESQQDGVFLQEEQMRLLEEALSGKDFTGEQLTELEALREDIQVASANLDKISPRVAEKEGIREKTGEATAVVEDLGKKDASGEAKTNKEKDDIDTPGEKADAYEHNKEADRFL